MPTFTHGSNARLLVNGYDLSAYFAQTAVAKSADTAETTAYTDTAKTYIAGLPDATLSAEGMFDGSAGAAGTVLDDALGTDYAVVSFYPAGTAASATGQGLYTTETSHEVSSPVDNVVAASFEAQSSQGAERLVAHASRTSGTAGGNATSIDNTVATSAGWSAYAHVRGTATAMTIVVHDSADDSTFAAVGTVISGAVTGATSARFSLAGNLRRYVRIVDTITAGTVTWQIGICRTPYL